MEISLFFLKFYNYANPSSDEPTQYKCAHMIKLDNGSFALQPNNRLMWKDMSFTTKQFPDKPDWMVDDKVWICEKTSDRWIVGDDSYFYNLKETN